MRLAIEESEQLARKKATDMVRAKRLAKEHARAARRLTGIPSSSSSLFDGGTSTDDGDPLRTWTLTPRTASASEDAKGKGPKRRR